MTLRSGLVPVTEYLAYAFGLTHSWCKIFSYLQRSWPLSAGNDRTQKRKYTVL